MSDTNGKPNHVQSPPDEYTASIARIEKEYQDALAKIDSDHQEAIRRLDRRAFWSYVAFGVFVVLSLALQVLSIVLRYWL